jgi:hypothetical protein
MRAMGAPGPECEMVSDFGFRPSVPRLSVIPVCYGGTSCKAYGWEADRTAGASSGRPAEGPRRRWRRVRARSPLTSSRAWRRSDSRSRERWVCPIPAGLGGCTATHVGPPRARAAPRSAGRAASPAACGRRRDGGTASCHRRLPRRGSSRARLPQVAVAESVFSRMPCGAIYCRRWPTVPGVEIAPSMLVHFAAAKRRVAGRLSRVMLRPGTGRSKMCIKQLYVLTVRGLYIN